MKKIKLAKLPKITADMREDSEIARITLRHDVYSRGPGYGEVRLMTQLQYTDEVVLNVADSSLVVQECDYETYYEWERMSRVIRAKLKSLGYKLIKSV